ncbi:hypothetical protein D9619_012203 [Psilocybe cf. subviscida]|uniref:MYND-type domain-containing protein n=1 Tax=Psilocybe cf. subviscida TaxID=2480587 RepID=A0A8H5B917_9AGAR|nr:hypothetical protein D9619_012203 [Psilocybe cf. subviscida]
MRGTWTPLAPRLPAINFRLIMTLSSILQSSPLHLTFISLPAMSTKELVQAFNALKRHPKAPSGTVPNEWHFDIRYVQLEPTPSHIIVFYQPQSQFIHLERLPVGISSREHGLSFFPETAQEAASEIVRGLLHTFANNTHMGFLAAPTAGPPLAPWKLMTTDKSLAQAVGMELKRQGVTPAPLCDVGISKPAVVRAVEDRWKTLFEKILQTTGFDAMLRAAIVTPTSIKFNTNLIKDPPIPGEDPDMDAEEKRANLILQYFNILGAAEPRDDRPDDGPALAARIAAQYEMLAESLERMNERHINSAADRGDSESALDYGIRLSLGLDCKRNRKRARDYLIKAAFSPTASDKVKAIAHGILIYWYVDSAADDFRLRYLYASCYHANVAAALAKRIYPTRESAAPNVLRFMKTVINNDNLDLPLDIHLFFKDMVRADQEREEVLREGVNEMYDKRLANPNRYRCAAIECPIEADTGSKLTRCDGQCDKEKKPYYCSTECQRDDWETHRPFCRPNAPCSVLKYQTASDIHRRTPSSKSAAGALIIPITSPDGKTTLFSSSTMTPKMLKAVKAATEKGGNLEEHVAAIQLTGQTK